MVKTQIQEGKEYNSAKKATRLVIPRWGTITLHVRQGEKHGRCEIVGWGGEE